MNKKRKLINALLVSTMMLSGLALDVSAAEATAVDRIGGKDRVETSVNVSNRAYADKADAVVVAGWEGQPDALTGTLLASAKDAPLLLVSNKDDDIASVRAEIERLGAKTLYILGDTNVVTQKAEDALGTGLTVKRVKGDDRFDTAVAVAKEVGSKTGHAFITVDGRSGELADALAAGPASGKNNSPILLTSKNSLPAQTKQALKDLNISSVTIVGGTSAVSTAVETAIKAEVSTVNRVYGDDRWETAEEVAKTYFAEADKAIITNDGRVSYADALVGGYFGALNDAPILLTQAGKLNAATTNFLGGRAMSAFVLGKEGVVSTAVKDAVGAIVDKNIEDAKEEALVVESVSAINAKTLEVTFNRAADVKADDFTVNKGTVKTNIASVAISEDKTVATIELTSKMTKGEYTVSVAQGEADALVASVTVEDEKVAKIEIVSEVAPITVTADSKASPAVVGKAEVGAKVLNQYGEDITRLNYTDVQVTIAGAASTGSLDKDGVLTLTLNDNAKVGDSIFATLVHKTTGVSTQATLKLSDKAAIKEITIGELYNKDGKTLSRDTDSKDKFYLPIEAKDQYGEEVSLTTLNDTDELRITNTNQAVATIVRTFTTMKIDGKDVNVMEVKKADIAGTTNIIAVALKTGANTTATVKVEEGVKIASLRLDSPQELVTAEKDVLFPLTVIDTAGNEVKTKKAYDEIKGKDPVTVTGGDVVEVKDKGLFVEVKAGGSPERVEQNKAITVVITSSTGKSSTQTVVPRAKAIPTVITGLDSKVSTALRENVGSTTIENTDLIVEDQYGQVITTKNGLKDVKFTATVETASDSILKAVKAGSPAVENTAWIVTPKNTEATSGKVTFKLVGEDVKEASALTKTFTIVKDSEFASYEVEDVPTIYAKKIDAVTSNVVKAYDKPIVVKATTTSGEVVKLDPAKDFTVVGKPAADGGVVTFAKDATTAKKTVTVTIARTGEELTKELTYSNVAPKVAEVKLVENGKIAAADTQVKLAELKAISSVKFDDETGAIGLTELATEVDFVVTDTYGMLVGYDDATNIKLADGEPADPAKLPVTLTLSNGSEGVKFNNLNGTNGAQVIEYVVGSTFDVVVKVDGISSNKVKVTTAKEAAYVPTLTNITAAATEIASGSASTENTEVAALSVTGTPSEGLTYTLAGGTDDANFKIVGNKLQIANGKTITAKEYTIKVKVAETAKPENTVTKDVTFTAKIGS